VVAMFVALVTSLPICFQLRQAERFSYSTASRCEPNCSREWLCAASDKYERFLLMKVAEYWLCKSNVSERL